MIQSLLIANRGEIACRIIRTARSMGIRTVAVYSDADAGALHVRQADEAVHIGPSPAAESYLVGEKIIAAAKETGVEAIHPGYGFLSENADFAQAVIDAGLVWVGPRPDSIRAMGLKDAAKQLMQQAGVPVTPGYMGEDQSPDRLAKEAEAIGYPVLIKAVAGGGGKGMRKVERAEDFAAALESAKREAKAAFGNDHVLLEKWITSPRHIEVQVFGDTHGNVVHLFERDCSLQRRHQKVIEEAPAPGMDETTREAICGAAVRAAKAVDYVGAGTVEFIADASEGLSADRIWFMEMNTRLQVEHPVTEEITGVDLVEWQLRVASGEELPLRQDEITMSGHAIEARLYAEDPTKGFLPSSGRIELIDLAAVGAGVDHLRIETGVETGDTVEPYYDPMIAKVIVWDEDRTPAIEGLADVISVQPVWPVKTNAPFLFKTLRHPSFKEAELTTSFLEDHVDALKIASEPTIGGLAHVARAIDAELDHQAYIPEFAGVWAVPDGFRLNAAPKVEIGLSHGADFYSVDPAISRAEYADVRLLQDGHLLVEQGQTFRITTFSHVGASSGAAADGAILAPMPGKVIALDVAEGDTVAEGQRLMVLEAMKMEHALTAPFAGTVRELAVATGAQVEVEQQLAKVERTAD
jgi:3-methylcrotonyl-CoA carboxylase alpha subunit